MRTTRYIVLALCFAVVLLALSSKSAAQFSPLDDLTAQIAKRLKKEKPNVIAVADFTAANGSKSAQGEYFAEFVAEQLVAHEKKLKVVDLKSFRDFLERQGLNPETIETPETLKRIGTQLGIDFLVTGAVETDLRSYSVRIVVYRVKDATMPMEKSTVMPRTGFTESLSAEFPPKTDYPVKNFEDRHIDPRSSHPPQCIYCPQPEFTDYARGEKKQGTSVFAVLVSVDGRAVAMHCRKMAGYGLDENAYNAMKTWKFKPAMTAQGEPISAIVEIEVTFHLY